MPIYTYKCECGKEFEKLVRTNTDEAQQCPACWRVAQKVVSPVSPFVWGKGGGWA